MINLKNIQNQKWLGINISILGAGKSGISAAKLCKFIGAKPFISESKNDVKLKEILSNFNYEIGGHSNKVLNCKLLIISPGIDSKVPIVQQCIKNKIPIVSEIEFASWFSDTPIIAVTGSNGKSTTVNLIKKMFDSAKIKSQLGGNFGTPFSDLILFEKRNPNLIKINILEVSSFQLEYVYHFSPNYSIILNISPDHLDRHETLENYLNQKLKILKNLREPGWLIFNSGDILLSNQLHDYERKIPFSQSYSDQALLSLNKTKIYYNDSNDVLIYFKDMGLRGTHNIENILAASTLAIKYGLKHRYIKQAIREIKPLNHRMEFVQEIDGVSYYNDSKATNIESTIAAVNSFKKNIILILGGRGKGKASYYKAFKFKKEKIKYIISYGEAGKMIQDNLQNKFKVEFFKEFQNAIKRTFEISNSGDTVLLSPSCSSFDQFKNYEERGTFFKKIINSKNKQC